MNLIDRSNNDAVHNRDVVLGGLAAKAEMDAQHPEVVLKNDPTAGLDLNQVRADEARAARDAAERNRLIVLEQDLRANHAVFEQLRQTRAANHAVFKQLRQTRAANRAAFWQLEHQNLLINKTSLEQLALNRTATRADFEQLKRDRNANHEQLDLNQAEHELIEDQLNLIAAERQRIADQFELNAAQFEMIQARMRQLGLDLAPQLPPGQGQAPRAPPPAPQVAL